MTTGELNRPARTEALRRPGFLIAGWLVMMASNITLKFECAIVAQTGR
jgi:hypothetical protein